MEMNEMREHWQHDELPRDQWPPPPKSGAPGIFGRVLDMRLAASHEQQRHCKPTCETCAVLSDRGRRRAAVQERYLALRRKIVATAEGRAWKSGRVANRKRAEREGHSSRNLDILTKHQAGMTAEQIKRSLGLDLSPQRINQIIRKLKA
jgi:hypothetical protein